MKRAIRMLVIGGVVAGLLAGASSASATPLVCKTGCFFTSIQSAINAAQSGATITVGKGNYEENLTATKPVTLAGAGLETVIYPAISHPTCPGEGSLCGGAASNIILVEASNVTIKGLRLEGANPNLTGGVMVGGKEINARNGIIENFNAGTFNNLTVSNVKVSDVYLRGIYASSEGTGFNFHNDTVENVQGEASSVAMFDFGGSGRMAYNKVIQANDAISANWSRGTEFLKNVISKSGSGVHTDNNGGFGGSADLIKENTVKECNVDGSGIFVFVQRTPSVSATVEGNKVTGCAVGLAVYGGEAAGLGPTTFSHNVVNGTGAATSNNTGTSGVYLTTDQLGFGFGDLTATLIHNSFSHFNTGMLVTKPGGGPATVTAEPENSFTSNGTGANGESGTVVEAKEDWWGCAAGPNMGRQCNTAIGTVNYTPWLTVKP